MTLKEKLEGHKKSQDKMTASDWEYHKDFFASNIK